MLEPKLRNPKHLDDALADIGLGRYHFLLAGTAALVAAGEGIELALLTIIVPRAARRWSFQEACTLALGAYGAQSAGVSLWVRVRCGPRRAAVVCGCGLAVGLGANRFARDLGTLCAAHVVTGIALAGCHSPLDLVRDLSPPASRRHFALFRDAAWAIGGAVAYVVAWLEGSVRVDNWRSVAATCAFVPALGVLGLLVLSYESPRWLVESERHSEAIRVVRALAVNCGVPDAFDDVETVITLDPKRRRAAVRLDSSLYSTQRLSSPTASAGSISNSSADVLLLEYGATLPARHVSKAFSSMPLLAPLLSLLFAFFFDAATYVGAVAIVAASFDTNGRNHYGLLALVTAAEIVGVVCWECVPLDRSAAPLSALLVGGFGAATVGVARRRAFVVLPAFFARASLGAMSAATRRGPADVLPPLLRAHGIVACQFAACFGRLAAAYPFLGYKSLLWRRAAILAGISVATSITTLSIGQPSNTDLRQLQLSLLREMGIAPITLFTTIEEGILDRPTDMSSISELTADSKTTVSTSSFSGTPERKSS
ncbi:hypothetical protein CTAYLR_002010 [Chrysophaeum taylorii]|uniref:Major facilitator superfamily (MFS) profile domain-containing protein n=1 Tax=Chrysophaeum taylorii TaxID=2483200 RepID=A0AAD7U9A7_9STRA|nr:hypothetical protein CTAYLR_002010 [Chrysophaeum taylorii]